MAKESEKSEESQQSSAPAQTQITKVIQAAAPKLYNWEVRTNNQQTAPVSVGRFRGLKGQKSKPPRTHPVTTSCRRAEIILKRSSSLLFPSREFLVPKTLQKHPSSLRWSPRTRGKNLGNIWKIRAKERETKQRPESPNKVRKTAVSVGNVMKGKNGQGQIRPSKRRKNQSSLW